jgi:hypothetical protein
VNAVEWVCVAMTILAWCVVAYQQHLHAVACERWSALEREHWQEFRAMQAEATTEREKLLDRVQSRDVQEYTGVRLAKETPRVPARKREPWENHPELRRSEVKPFRSPDGVKMRRVLTGPPGDRDREDMTEAEFMDRYNRPRDEREEVAS